MIKKCPKETLIKTRNIKVIGRSKTTKESNKNNPITNKELTL
jgi:hypothetical protein